MSGYTPQEGSTAWRAVEFFTTHPEERLTSDRLAEKFGKPSKQWHSLLSDAVQAGVLHRRTNEDGDLEYYLGSGCPAVVAAPHRHPTSRPDVLLAGGVLGLKAAQKTPLADFDFAAVTIRKGVPLPAPAAAPMHPMRALLLRFEVGDSVELPESHYESAKNVAGRLKKLGVGTWTIKRVGAGIGIWRTA